VENYFPKTNAFLLNKEGWKVVLLERGGGKLTSYNTRRKEGKYLLKKDKEITEKGKRKAEGTRGKGRINQTSEQNHVCIEREPKEG